MNIARKMFYLTKEGLDRFRTKFQNLKELRMQKVKEAESEEEVEFIDVQLLEVASILKSYELISLPPKNSRNTVGLGAMVSVEANNGRTKDFVIVGALEADPGQGKISNESPVGRALFGKKVGEAALVKVNSSDLKYKILKINYGSQGKTRFA